MRVLRNQQGFTLMELLVALALSSLLMAVVFKSMLDVQRSWRVSRVQVEDVRNERAGVSAIIRDVRMAGSGFGGRPICVAGLETDFIYPLQPKPGTGVNPDTLLVTSAFRGISSSTTAGCVAPGDDIFIEDTSIFDAGDLIVVTDGVIANMFEVTLVLSNQLVCAATSSYNDPLGHVQWPGGGYLTGSTVCSVERVQYWIDPTYSTPRLMRQVNSSAPESVALGIENLSLDYVLQTGDLVRTVSDPSTILSVVLGYVESNNAALEQIMKAGGEMITLKGDSISVRIQPRVL